jgi:hypothetical protein
VELEPSVAAELLVEREVEELVERELEVLVEAEDEVEVLPLVVVLDVEMGT